MESEINLEGIKARVEEEIKEVKNLDQFLRLKSKYIGKKESLLMSLREKIKSGTSEEKRILGMKFNEIKDFLEEFFKRKEGEFKKKEEKKVDITLPGLIRSPGKFHPVSQMMEEIIGVFKSMNFDVAEGPEVETDFFNFEALNIPKWHPARDMQDTLYIGGEKLLRTHTSPVQIRVMMARRPPVRIIAPGRVYRRDSDVSHTPMFHQVEGLYVDKGVKFIHLKGTIELFLKAIFGEETKIRFRPSYFPFTEPSAEVDIGCVLCGGKGCRVCGSGWLEIMGCGMVHPNVFKAVEYPEGIQGYAFGLGVERLAMLKFRINDIRLLFENDIRFLRQF
jgi:phenylalanyl-tRNA synthetase alpha chain